MTAPACLRLRAMRQQVILSFHQKEQKESILSLWVGAGLRSDICRYHVVEWPAAARRLVSCFLRRVSGMLQRAMIFRCIALSKNK